MTVEQRSQCRTAVPFSEHYRDRYFSSNGGFAESCHVFLTGNRLPDRFRDGFQLAELGFGTGRNLLVSLKAWLDKGQRGTLFYTGFESRLLSVHEIRSALSTMPELSELSPLLLAPLQDGRSRFSIGTMMVSIIIGDARHTVPNWQGIADAWFLDGFAPDRNPEMWEASLLAAVAKHTSPGGSFATYTSSGLVRRNLLDAEFNVLRVGGFARKRHMLKGTLAAAQPGLSEETD